MHLFDTKDALPLFLPNNQFHKLIMASLSLRSGCACTQQEVIRTRQSPIPMEVELHKKLATGQNISSLSSLE